MTAIEGLLGQEEPKNIEKNEEPKKFTKMLTPLATPSDDDEQLVLNESHDPFDVSDLLSVEGEDVQESQV